MSDTQRIRLDVLVAARGLAATRAQARDLILRGGIRVDGRPMGKPGQTVAERAHIDIVEGTQQFVSRAGIKLAAALAHFGFNATDRIALDIGAATGGFTQVLLQAGARRVYAVDVGREQLHADLRTDPKVISLESCDVRALTSDMLPEAVSIIVADTSFISLTLALPPALKFASRETWLIALIKPQFEVGRAAIGKGGIVREQADRDRAVLRVKTCVSDQPGWNVVDVIASPITGSGGNQEYLLGAKYEGAPRD